MQGDARREDAYAAALGGERADALVTDPPYCLLTRRRKRGDLRDPHARRKVDQGPVLRFESVRDYRAFTEEWLPRAVSHLRPGAPLAVWTNFLGKEPISSATRGLDYQLAGEFVWAKRTTEHDGNEQLLRVYETALLFLREPLPPLGNHKPFSVLEALLRGWTRPGQLVLDPFAGSGSIPAAAVLLRRRAACLEIEPEWARRVNERLAAAAG